jgi:hypothetical protein
MNNEIRPISQLFMQLNKVLRGDGEVGWKQAKI